MSPYLKDSEKEAKIIARRKAMDELQKTYIQLQKACLYLHGSSLSEGMHIATQIENLAIKVETEINELS